MYIADGHCDYLYKSLRNQSTAVSVESLKKNHVKLQNFAIFVEPTRKTAVDVREVYAQLALFEQLIKANKDIQPVTKKAHLQSSRALLCLLSIEGCNVLSYQADMFDRLWERGVRMYGLVWNYDNLYAGTCYAEKQKGLSGQGIMLLRKIADRQGILDVSHMSEACFWDCLQYLPKGAGVVASHSNCRSLCNHRRNLTDRQIQALIEAGGIIGVNFVPMFLNEHRAADIHDVIAHIDKIIALGGEDHVALGSDFDGADMIDDLPSPDAYSTLAKVLHKRYNKEIVGKIMYGNWHRFLSNMLPD